MAKAKAKGASPWYADKIELRDVSALIPYAGNARSHPPEQIAQLAESIQQFGFTIPVLVDKTGTIVAGHGRVLAAQKLGLSAVPVILAPDDWSDAKRRAYILADNKLALNAEWDVTALTKELAALNDLDSLGELDFSTSVIGFSDDDLARLFDDKAGKDIRAIAGETVEEPEAPVVGAAAGDETTSFTTPLTHDEATLIHAAIRQCKRETGALTAGAALVTICREWQEAAH